MHDPKRASQFVRAVENPRSFLSGKRILTLAAAAESYVCGPQLCISVLERVASPVFASKRIA